MSLFSLKTKLVCVHPRVFVQDLLMWRPSWIKELNNEPEDSSDEEADEPPKKKRKTDKSSMNMLEWRVSFEEYAMAAAAVGQWEFWSSRAHLLVCDQVAGEFAVCVRALSCLNKCA